MRHVAAAITPCSGPHTRLPAFTRALHHKKSTFILPTPQTSRCKVLSSFRKEDAARKEPMTPQSPFVSADIAFPGDPARRSWDGCPARWRQRGIVQSSGTKMCVHHGLHYCNANCVHATVHEFGMQRRKGDLLVVNLKLSFLAKSIPLHGRIPANTPPLWRCRISSSTFIHCFFFATDDASRNNVRRRPTRFTAGLFIPRNKKVSNVL